MGPLRIGVLVMGLAVVTLEIALGVAPGGVLLSLVGIALLYVLARLGRPRPPGHG